MRAISLFVNEAQIPTCNKLLHCETLAFSSEAREFHNATIIEASLSVLSHTNKNDLQRPVCIQSTSIRLTL